MKLTDPVTDLPYVGESYELKLKKLGIYTIEDLLHHVPSRFLDYRNLTPIKNLQMGEDSTIAGEILSITQIFTKNGKRMQLAKVADDTGEIELLWVNQPFLLRMLRKGMYVQFFGKLNFWGKKRVMSFPKFEILGTKGVVKGKMLPIYPETEGLSSKWLLARTKDALLKINNFNDYFNLEILKNLELASLEKALNLIHDPKDIEDWEKGVTRLAFNELLLLQLQNAFDRIEWQDQNKSLDFKLDTNLSNMFEEKLPFEFTNSQKTSVQEIYLDLNKKFPMNRLLQGDVGSGKTAVAAFAIFASFVNGHQSVLMAPTQVLAQQHFNTLKSLLKDFNMRISLITGSVTNVPLGKSDLIIGTHALLHRPHLFDRTAVVVIDEQHRFGVRQRAKILENTKSDNHTPHILSMTATPIPRTITLTMYGDLDISTLDEMPAGRIPIKTWVVPNAKRKKAYKWIEEQIVKHKIQVFVVCPFIEESDEDNLKQVKAATIEYEKIKEIMPKLKIGLLHGKLKPDVKNNVLNDFKNHKLDMLVTTPVIEVGIDIPNATIMMIEAADRFGLAQLHQLRGRVGRGDKQSYCLLFTENKSRDSRKRLKLMEQYKDGRKLAEMDLEIRGPGEVFGIRQSGLPELKIAKWDDISLIKKSKKFAFKVAKNQKRYPKIIAHYKRKQISNN